MPEPGDDRLVAACRRGDPRALAELYRRHAPPLLGYLLRMTGERAEAEDVLQETFLRIFEGRGSYTGRGRFRSWLFTIATRIALDHRRAERRHRDLAAGGFAGGGGAPAPDPSHAAELRHLAGIVDSALSDLPPAYAQAFYLRVHEGWSYRDLAALSGEPEGTLRSRVHHALARVQRILRKRDPDRSERHPKKEKQP